MSERTSSRKTNKHIYDFIGIEDVILEYVIDSGYKDYKNFSKKLTENILKNQPKNQSDFQQIIYGFNHPFFDFNEITKDKFWADFPWTDILNNQVVITNNEPKQKVRKTIRRKTISLKIRLLILERDGYKCQLCGKTAKDTHLEVDHKIPVAKGGTDSLDNLWTLCIECNRGKSDLSIKT
jgi:5-methylcytosine-specific restriction endonuclease McrA